MKNPTVHISVSKRLIIAKSHGKQSPRQQSVSKADKSTRIQGFDRCDFYFQLLEQSETTNTQKKEVIALSYQHFYCCILLNDFCLSIVCLQLLSNFAPKQSILSRLMFFTSFLSRVSSHVTIQQHQNSNTVLHIFKINHKMVDF